MLLSSKQYAFIDRNRIIRKHKKILVLYEWVEAVVIGIALVFFVFTFIVSGYTVKGTSMNPTLNNGDRLLLSLIYTKPKRGDIVVVTQPNQVDEEDTKRLFKRVIAVEGEEIDIDFGSGIVYINGYPIDESYVMEPTYTNGVLPMSFPLVVDEGKVFVMGDNRNESRDSRDQSVGLVDARYLKGKAIFKFWPMNDLKFYGIFKTVA